MEYVEILIAMSDSKGRAKAKIEGLGEPIRLHLYKLIFYGDADPTWKKDIFKWLITIQLIRTKPKNKLLKQGQYFELLHNIPLVGNDSMLFELYYKDIQSDIEEKNHIIPLVDYKDIKSNTNLWYKLLHNFFKDIDVMLYSNSLDKSTVMQMIKKIVTKSQG